MGQGNRDRGTWESLMPLVVKRCIRQPVRCQFLLVHRMKIWYSFSDRNSNPRLTSGGFSIRYDRYFRETEQVFVIRDLIRVDPVSMKPVPIKWEVFSNKWTNMTFPDRTPGLHKYSDTRCNFNRELPWVVRLFCAAKRNVLLSPYPGIPGQYWRRCAFPFYWIIAVISD